MNLSRKKDKKGKKPERSLSDSERRPYVNDIVALSIGRLPRLSAGGAVAQEISVEISAYPIWKEASSR